MGEEKQPRSLKVSKVRKTCYGYPTTYEFEDNQGKSYYFRLRHGYASLECENTDEVLIEGEMAGFAGVCEWGDVQAWAKYKGVEIQK